MPQVWTLFGKMLQRTALTVALLSAAIGSPQAAEADSLADANKAAALPSGTVSADEKLFPVIAAMDRAPVSIRASAASGGAMLISFLDLASIASPVSDEWSDLEEWAKGEKQQAVLASIKEVTDPKGKFRIGFPYGSEGVSEEWIAAGLSVPLQSDNLLATARWDYLVRMIEVSQLCSVEAMRLADSGEGDKALEVLLGWMRLARMIADRPSYNECATALILMQRASERMRDIAYLYPKSFTESGLREHLAQMANDKRERGLERVPFPSFERYSVQQIIDDTFVARGGIKPGEFAGRMASVTSVDHPLKFMAEAAYWRGVAATHAQWFDTTDELERVYGDWNLRWGVVEVSDPILLKASHYARMDASQYRLITYLCEPLENLLDVRERTGAEIEGTRAALGVVGFRLKQKSWPPSVNAVSPEWVRPPAVDYYHFDQRKQGLVPFSYFVPIRDDKFGPREEPHPHALTIMPGPSALPESDLPLRYTFANISTFLDGKGAPSLNRIPDARPELVGRPAPKWNLSEWAGEQVDFDAIGGKPVLLFFWSQSSPPSLANMVMVSMLHARYAPQGLLVLGIADGSIGEKSLADLAAELKLGFAIARDSNGQAIKDYKVDALPWYVLIGPDGTVLGSGVPADQLENAVGALMVKSGAVSRDMAMGGMDMSELSGMDPMATLTGGDPTTLAILPFIIPDGADLIDPATGKFDSAKLRVAMNKSVMDNGEQTTMILASILMPLAASDEDIDTLIQRALSDENAEALASLGTSGAMLGKLTRIMFSQPAFADLARKVKSNAVTVRAEVQASGEEPDPAQFGQLISKIMPDAGVLRTALTEVANAYTAPENADLMDEIAAQFTAQSAASSQAGAAAALITAVPVTANIDDNDFILYSAGWDNEANRCRVAGYKGDDLLIYPAPLTLRRQMMGIEPPRNN